MKKIETLCALLPIMLTPAFAQTWVPMTPGQYMGSRAIGAVGDFAMAIGELATANQAIENEVVLARVAFFNVPEGPARIEAARRFNDAMMKRDLHYVAQRIVDGSNQATPLLGLMTELAGSHRVDGGLSPYSYQTFKPWADAVINSVAFKSPLEKALRDAMPQFEKYRPERDIVEMLFYNPQSPLRAQNAKPIEYLAAWLLATKDAKTFQEANASAASIARQAGPQRLAQIVEVLKSWSTTDNHLSGPWRASPRLALDPLVAGNPGEPYPFDASARRIVFTEARSDFSRYHANFVPQLDEIERLWNQGRASKDIETLRLLVARRDELGVRIKAAQQQKGWDTSGRPQADLMLSHLHSNLSFIDTALQVTELNAMKAGQMNPLEEEARTVTREYLAKSSKLQLRSISAQQQMAEQGQRLNGQARTQPGAGRSTPEGSRTELANSAPAGSARTPAGPASPALPPRPAAAPVSGDPSTLFDRAIAIVDDPQFQDGLVRMNLFDLARAWERWTATPNPPRAWLPNIDHMVSGVEGAIAQQRDFLKRVEDSVTKMVPAQRENYEKNLGKRDSLRRELIAELEGMLPKLKEAIAEIRKKAV